MKTENSIDLYEIQGRKIDFDRPALKVKSHRNRKDLVILEYNGKTITVLADELERAIENAQNAHKY